MAETIFRKGFIPPTEKTPAEKTHKRARLVYRLLYVLIRFVPQKQKAALKELQQANSILYDRVKKTLGELTPEEISWHIGPRPHFHDDGSLVIVDPIRDDPVLMRVYANEEPSDASGVWTPGRGIGPELAAIQRQGRVIVGRN